jgi:hypothetical protein
MSTNITDRFITQEIRKFDSYAELDGKVCIPSIQRSIIVEHVQEMISHVSEQHARGMAPIFGAIDLVELDGFNFVIDGQHRLAALEACFKSYNHQTPFFCVIYHVKTRDQMAEIFMIRNKGIPVPDFILNVEGPKHQLLKEIQDAIHKIPLFDSRLNRRPHINIKIFIDQIARSRMLELIENLNDFVSIFAKINNDNQSKFSTATMRKRYDVSDRMYQICNEKNVWIGLDKNMPWFDEGYDLRPFQDLLQQQRVNNPPPY